MAYLTIPGLERISSVITIQGSIGSGKSTFMRALLEYCNVEKCNAEREEHFEEEWEGVKDFFLFVDEPLERWLEKILEVDGEMISMLAAYYRDIEGMAFRFQIFTFSTRLEALISAISRIMAPAGCTRPYRVHIIAERSLRADNLFFHMAPEKATKGADGITYRQLHGLNCGEFNKKESHMLFVPTPRLVCMDRIQERDRAAETESPISEDYMKRLEEKHLEMVEKFRQEKGSSSVMSLDRLSHKLAPEEITSYALETMSNIRELIK